MPALFAVLKHFLTARPPCRACPAANPARLTSERLKDMCSRRDENLPGDRWSSLRQNQSRLNGPRATAPPVQTAPHQPESIENLPRPETNAGNSFPTSAIHFEKYCRLTRP